MTSGRDPAKLSILHRELYQQSATIDGRGRRCPSLFVESQQNSAPAANFPSNSNRLTPSMVSAFPCFAGSNERAELFSATLMAAHVLVPIRTRKRSTHMKLYSYKLFASLALMAVGLMLTGCEQTPAATSAAPAAAPAPVQAPGPSTTTESTSNTRSSEVTSDPSNPDATTAKTTSSESTTVKQKQ